MLALLALFCFIPATFGIDHLGPLNLIALGLAFIAAHLLLGGITLPWTRRPQQ